MRNTLRFMSVAVVFVLCFALMAACGKADAEPTQKATEVTTIATTVSDETEPFVAPPDALGKVVSADTSLITWNVYEISDETIDFMGIDVKELGKPSEEMTLFYFDGEVTYYIVSEGKLVAATYEDVVADSIVGITTLEEGVQEVYIIYVPEIDDGSDDYEDTVEEIVEETVATSVATEETVLEDTEVATEPSEEISEETEVPEYEEPSLEETTEESTEDAGN